MKRGPALASAGAAVLAGGLAGGFFIGQGVGGSERARLDGNSLCAGQFGWDSSAWFESLLPAGQTLTSESEIMGSAKDLNWMSRCSVDSGDSAAVSIFSETLSLSAAEWKDLMRRQGVTTEGKLKKVAIGDMGLSTPNTAAVYVRCDNPGFTERPVRLSITVRALGKAKREGDESRRDLADIALQASQAAVDRTSCEPDMENLIWDHAPPIK